MFQSPAQESTIRVARTTSFAVICLIPVLQAFRRFDRSYPGSMTGARAGRITRASHQQFTIGPKQ
jgi:hypothetical protein